MLEAPELLVDLLCSLVEGDEPSSSRLPSLALAAALAERAALAAPARSLLGLGLLPLKLLLAPAVVLLLCDVGLLDRREP